MLRSPWALVFSGGRSKPGPCLPGPVIFPKDADKKTSRESVQCREALQRRLLDKDQPALACGGGMPHAEERAVWETVPGGVPGRSRRGIRGQVLDCLNSSHWLLSLGPQGQPPSFATGRLFCKHTGNILFPSKPAHPPSPKKLGKLPRSKFSLAGDLLTLLLPTSGCLESSFTLKFNPFLPRGPPPV